MRTDARPRHYYGTCLFTEPETDRQWRILVFYYFDGQRAWVEPVFDGVERPTRELTFEAFEFWRGDVEPSGPGGQRDVAELLTLEGKPLLSAVQEAIRRTRARRDALERLRDELIAECERATETAAWLQRLSDARESLVSFPLDYSMVAD